MEIIFFDTETTSLPAKGHDWKTDYEHFPYIVSIAWIFRDGEKHYILNQEGRTIPPDATAIHGITTEQGNKSLYYFDHVMASFLVQAMRADKIIGCNPYFDTSIIKANILRRYGVNSFEAKLAIEALDKSKRIDIIRLFQKKFGGKWNNLQEIYRKLFAHAFDAHHALNDCRACKRIYEELIK